MQLTGNVKLPVLGLCGCSMRSACTLPLSSAMKKVLSALGYKKRFWLYLANSTKSIACPSFTILARIGEEWVSYILNFVSVALRKDQVLATD